MKKVIPTDQHITYQYQYRKCGKASCSTCRNTQGHGPYWYAYWRTGAKLISGYVGKSNPKPNQQNPAPSVAVSASLPNQQIPATPAPVVCSQEHTSNSHVANISVTNSIVDEIIQAPVLV
ncbi:MAG TPA: hypothetical protein VKR06_02870 [Ktedonosporobacter sp.]|nr:hypothetical protein [Ktedonosporobacter sp.]